MKKIIDTDSDLYKDILEVINYLLKNPYDILDKYLNKDIFIIQYDDGEIIFNEGDDAGDFFMICRGSVGVYRNDKEIAILEQGDFFGEMSIVFSEYRSATIKSISNCVCLRIPKNIFNMLIDTDNEFKKIIERYAINRKMLNE